MNKQDIIKHLHQSVIRENLTAYRKLFLNTNINEVTDPNWKEALKFFTELSNENKDVLFKIIEQIEVDTLSTVLGVIDEGVMIEDKEVEFELTINDNSEPVNGDLQDLFLEYDEENR